MTALTGARGQVKLAYRVAAEVAGFSFVIDRATTGGRLTGTVTASDPLLLASSPLRFVVATKGGAWRWPIETIRIDGAQLVATLGPREQD